MNWTKEPVSEGYYWQRKNQYKSECIYYVWISIKESVGKDYNVFYCRRVGQQLEDKEKVTDVGGEWYGPLDPPK